MNFPLNKLLFVSAALLYLALLFGLSGSDSIRHNLSQNIDATGYFYTEVEGFDGF